MPPLCPWHRACQGCVWVSFGARWGRNTAMSQLVPRVVPPEVPLPLRWCRKQCRWAMDPQDHMWAKPILHNLETWKYLWSWPERCNIQKHIGHWGGKSPWCSLSGKFIPFPNSSFCYGCCWSRAHTNTETFFKVSSSHQSLRLMFFLTQLLPQACWPFSSYTKTEKQKKGGMETWEVMGALEAEMQEHDERWPELTLGSGVLQQTVRRARKGQWEAQRREHQMRLETLIQEEDIVCPSLPNEEQEQFKSQEQCWKVNCKERASVLWKETVPEGTHSCSSLRQCSPGAMEPHRSPSSWIRCSQH